MSNPAILKTCRSSRYLGGLGAVIGCSGMIVGALSGAVGATATGVAKSGSMDGMAGMQSSSSNPGWVNAINTVGQPLLVVSLLLVIIGLWPRGPIATGLAMIGSVLFYVFMFVQYNVPLALIAALILLSAYLAALWPSARYRLASFMR